jgi:uncharacterized damage-inducible protein DinB
MKMTDLFLQEIEREAGRSRRVLEQVPDGHYDWKPHERSMIFGYLADIVATIPSWVAMEIEQDELDLAPKDGPTRKPAPKTTSAVLLAAHDEAVAKARTALQGTTDDHLMTSWRLLVAGNVVSDAPRHVMIRDTINHLAHHRGQMTVYLRLLGAKVPALYGPSADDQRFG